MSTLKIKYFELTHQLRSKALKLRYKLLNRYYEGLAIQARYLYRQSELYKLRWQEMGLDFADEMWSKDRFYFFEKARQEPIIIRTKIFWDTMILKKPIEELQSHVLRDNIL